MTSATTDADPLTKAARATPKGTATYTMAELAELLGVSTRHVQRLNAAKMIPGLLRLGGRVVFAKVQVDCWLSGSK